MKYLLSLMIIIPVLFLMSAVHADESYIYEDYIYTILSDGTAEIAAYRGHAEKLTIPESIEDISVTSIGPNAFSLNKSITAVTIPDSVLTIGERSFYHCSDLSHLDLPNDLIFIGDEAFSSCSSLITVFLPTSLESIGYRAFSQCNNLKTVTFHSKISEIKDGTFSDCTELSSIIIPDGCTVIGANAFSNCTYLKTVSIPDSVRSISESTFLNCASDLTVDASPKSFAAKYAAANHFPLTRSASAGRYLFPISVVFVILLFITLMVLKRRHLLHRIFLFKKYRHFTPSNNKHH